MRLLNQHDGNELASVFEDLASLLRKGTMPDGAISRANEWDGPLRATNTDPGRSSEPGDPTSASATGRAEWTTTVAAEIAQAALAMGRNAVILANKIGMIPAPIEPPKSGVKGQTAQQLRDELADQNSGAGWCEICGDRASGGRDDRLSAMRVVESVWHNGETTDEVHERRVDQACRKAWGRWTAANGSVGFLDWEQQRKHGRERETA